MKKVDVRSCDTCKYNTLAGVTRVMHWCRIFKFMHCGLLLPYWLPKKKEKAHA